MTAKRTHRHFLEEARKRFFVGRDVEKELFDRALTANENPLLVIWFHGPGGVGKTDLLREFTYICNQNKTPWLLVDQPATPLPPDDYLKTIHQTFKNHPAFEGRNPGVIKSPSEVSKAILKLKQPGRKIVLFLDGMDHLDDLESWLQHEFLPALSEDILVVAAGRAVPSPAWRTDLGWQTLMRCCPLRNLSWEESETYLKIQGIPDEARDRMISLSYGYPLALSLLADLYRQDPDWRPQTELPAEILPPLLARFAGTTPSSDHLKGLYAAAHLFVVDQAFLASLLSPKAAGKVYQWLSNLGFMQHTAQGLLMHGLTREILLADAHNRVPGLLDSINRASYGYFTKKFLSSTGIDRLLLVTNRLYMERNNPAFKPSMDHLEKRYPHGGFLTSVFLNHCKPMKSRDWPEVAEVIRREEGSQPEKQCREWRLRKGSRFFVVRSRLTSKIAGYAGVLSLNPSDPQEWELDEEAAKAMRWLAEKSPLRDGESADYLRHWGAPGVGQDFSPIVGVTLVNIIAEFSVNDQAQGVVQFIASNEGDLWGPLFTFGGFEQVPELSFDAHGRSYDVFWMDWRRMPWRSFSEAITNLVKMDFSEAERLRRREDLALLALDKSEFTKAVIKAVKSWSKPARWPSNPLLRTRLLASRVNPEVALITRVEMLRQIILDALQELEKTPKGRLAGAAVRHTWISPHTTQQEAAASLGMAFSTYRRYGVQGLEQIAAILWLKESSD